MMVSLVTNLLFLVTVQIVSRKVTVKGRKGEVSKDFSHIPCELQMMKQNDKKRQGTYVRIRMWFGTYKNCCSVRTLRSLIKNMLVGTHEVSLSASLQLVVVSRSLLLWQFN